MPISEKAQRKIDSIVDSIADAATFGAQYGLIPCFRQKVNSFYNELVQNDPDWEAKKKERKDVDDLNRLVPRAAIRVWREDRELNRSKEFLRQCLTNEYARLENEEIGQQAPNNISLDFPPTADRSPWDNRLERLMAGSEFVVRPYDSRFSDAATQGYFLDPESLTQSEIVNSQETALAASANRAAASTDPFYRGVPAVNNSYALVRLFGSDGGKSLVDQKGERKWYEIDSTNDSIESYSKNPDTTSIIRWGEGDPYGRTPYHFSDFVFCKFWNIVPNNRMITLRRYPAPIVDNLKFPGMDGFTGSGTPANKSDEGRGNNIGDITEDQTGNTPKNTSKSGNQTGVNNEDQGSGAKIDFPPMATAVTYFGEETDNQLSDILKFTTGLNWGEVESNVWDVTTESNPNLEAGPGGAFGGLAKMANMLNIATGDYDTNAMLNQETLPPDPYKDGGPYENRIIGPVNAITAVKKRERGLKYTNDISLKFEYVARPIGGVNTKAILLDIISNFLVIGSASAMFWGGQHRFMGQPQKYPFLGGDKGIQQWYRGDPIGWGGTTVKSFGQKVTQSGGLGDMVKDFFSTLLGGGGEVGGGFFGSLSNIMKGDNAASNIVKHELVKRSGGSIPYLSGLKALLIGEPVGEWHLTIGNPFNPIAMIGNLVCDNIEVEFGNELGPDDFPLEVKVQVNLQHGMARDRDAIQSMFNRGMGRIYDLPDGVSFSSDYQTTVDSFTKGGKTSAGQSPADWRLGTVIGGAATSGGKTGPSKIVDNSLQGEISVWNRTRFASVSPNQQNLTFSNGSIENRSQFRSATWIAKKTTN